jgi:hypothetical protein
MNIIIGDRITLSPFNLEPRIKKRKRTFFEIILIYSERTSSFLIRSLGKSGLERGRISVSN